jgi:ParB family chromosome partitioning protein
VSPPQARSRQRRSGTAKDPLKNLADECTLSRLLVEASILLAALRGNATSTLKEAATAFKVDTDAIAAKWRQEFAAKQKAKKTTQSASKSLKKAA